MATVSTPSVAADAAPFALPQSWTLGDLQRHLGGIPIDRVRLFPLPGTGTADDTETVQRDGERLCELVDGVLVEKPMGTLESLVAMEVAFALRRYLEDHPLGVVLGADGLLQIGPKLVRGPDVSFISWEKFPGRTLPTDRVWAVVPDLVVEVLSPGNTQAEMEREVTDYLSAGTHVVWIIDPATRTALVHTVSAAGVGKALLTADDRLTATALLPGLSIPVSAVLR
ncbi:MAG: Uma2 family endonuclease [Planctomycetota bacterium]